MMKRLSRRDFLSESSLAITAVAAVGGGRGPGRGLLAGASEPHLEFPAVPRERLAVASWPFRAFIVSPTNYDRDRRKPGMDLKQFPAMVAERFNLHNIEPLGDHFASTQPAYLSEFREAIAKAGSHAVDIPCGGNHSFYDPDAAKRRQSVEDAKKWVDVAVAIGSPSIRAHVAGVHGVKPNVDRTAESLRQLADYGAEKNVIINLENDDLVTEDAFFIVQVIEKVNHPWLHALPDFCNSMMTGNADFNYRAVTAMFTHAYNIAHMKDEEGDGTGKWYSIDVARTFAIAKDAGYRGYFSMEWEGNGEPFGGTQRLIDESLKSLA
jgi:sugar phosphate isomerase/epimerase